MNSIRAMQFLDDKQIQPHHQTPIPDTRPLLQRSPITNMPGFQNPSRYGRSSLVRGFNENLLKT